MNERIKQILFLLGVDVNSDPRWDDNATAMFADQLRAIESQLYRELYPQLRAFEFVPTQTNIPPGAEQWGYYMFNKVGIAKIIANYATDLEDVALLAKREFVSIVGIGKKYSWSIQDVRAAAMANVPLQSEKAEIARMAIATKIDDMAALGDSSAGLFGLLNQPAVGLVTPITGDWATATASELIEDVKWLINSTNAKNNKQLPVNQVVMPDTHLQYLTQTLMSTTGGTNLLVIDVLRKMFPGITFSDWDKTETADAAGTGPRLSAYHKAPMVVQFPLPVVFEALPPQAVSLKFEVPCHGRAGGVVCRYPIAMSYMDGC